MTRKERYIASLEEVTITRSSDRAFIEYNEEGIDATLLHIGPQANAMCDQEILHLHNECLRQCAQAASQNKYVALEIPLGSAQIKHFSSDDRWVPKCGILRCLIRENAAGGLIVEIDDLELNLEQFGRLLTNLAGWGMRIEFVPSSEIHRRPAREIYGLNPEGDHD